MSANSSRFSLFKRSNQIYYIGYYREGKRRWKSTGVSTKPEAFKVLTQFRELLEADTPSVSLQEFRERFLSSVGASYAEKTRGIYKTVFERFQKLVGNLYLVEITSEHFDRYKAYRLKRASPKSKELSSVSLNIELRALRAAFNTAHRWKLIPSNPFKEVTFADVPDKAPAFFTAGDFQTLLDNIPEGWLKEVILFAVLTGLRQGEMLNLTWSDIDFSRRVLTIETSATFKTKQGRRRIVPLSESAISLLKSRQARSTSEYVFTLNDKPILPGWLSHLFKRRLTDAKLPPGLHWHSLRHYAEFRIMPSSA